MGCLAKRERMYAAQYSLRSTLYIREPIIESLELSLKFNKTFLVEANWMLVFPIGVFKVNSRLCVLNWYYAHLLFS